MSDKPAFEEDAFQALEKDFQDVVNELMGDKTLERYSIFYFCFIFNLSRDSNQCAIRALLEVASHLSTTPRWRNPAKCLSQRHK